MLTCSLVLLALFASVQGRAVNISNTWVLPEEGFPVFYRYFRDRISWYEADAVCQFHHANLVTVDTTAQYDAVRAYLKELDISSAVWVGLIRSNPDGDFTWTDYRGMSGDGYWSAAPDARAAPLCAAADPAADYRWEARACGGPTVASFICELPVPQWALGNEGCMVRALPALTILYLPESAAVQLTADCGLAGVKRVQCTGNVKRDSLLKDLSCNDEEESSSTSNPVVGSSTWSLSDLSVNTTDWETSETTPEEDTTTQHESEITHSTPSSTTEKEKQPTKPIKLKNKLNNIYTQKNINLDLLHNNNLQSNDIPKLANNENFLSLEQSEKLEDEKHMHHKMLHDELAKHANYEIIFTQPTDHFVPPLVMAKAKISDDMTVLSLAEKHAQQVAEQGFSKHNVLAEHSHSDNFRSKSTTEEPSKTEIMDKPLVMTLQPINIKDNPKKDKVKLSLPKKYIEKYEDPKGRISKIDGKLLKFDKSTEKYSTAMEITTKVTEMTSLETTEMNKLKLQDDSIELTVLLKEPNKTNTDATASVPEMHEPNKDFKPTEHQKNITVTMPIDVAIGVNNIQKTTPQMTTEIKSASTDGPLEHETIKTTQGPFKIGTEENQDVYLNHEVIKITIVNDESKVNPTQTVFEVTTLVPEFKDTGKSNDKLGQSTTTQQSVITTEETTQTNLNVTVNSEVTQEAIITTRATEATSTSNSFITTAESIMPLKENKTVTAELPPTTKAVNYTETTFTTHIIETRVSEQHVSPTTSTTSEPYTTMKEKTDNFNISDIFEDNDRNSTDPEAIDDFNSPLLSAANEPLHRPNRSRRPQPPARLNKFNPFRILG